MKKVCESCYEHAPPEIAARATIEVTTLQSSEASGQTRTLRMSMSVAAPPRIGNHNTRTLYHCTDDKGARAIASTGFMLRGSIHCTVSAS
jgi:hypothetical protein